MNYIIVSEFVAGGNLKEKVNATIFEEFQVAHIARQILSCLATMHAKNVVHRDIKMDNVMCMPMEEGKDSIIRIKVMDFGFAHFF